MSERRGYIRIMAVVSSDDGQGERNCMTSIQVEIPAGVSFKVAKLHALEKITAELDRYGLHECLGGLGLKDPAYG